MTAGVNAPHIGLVVEGPGDRDALPALLRAHLASVGEYRDVFGKPVPCKGRGSATVPGGVEGYVAAAAGRPGCRAVMVVLDSDEDMVCDLGPALAERVKKVTHIPAKIVLAERCFEDWLYASIETLQLGEIEFDAAKKGLNEIKSAVSRSHSLKYVKPVWQPRLASRLDIPLVRSRNASFDRLIAVVEKYVKLL